MELFDIVADATKMQATAARTMGRTASTIDSAVAVMAEAAEAIKQDRDRIVSLEREVKRIKSEVGELAVSLARFQGGLDEVRGEQPRPPAAPHLHDLDRTRAHVDARYVSRSE